MRTRFASAGALVVCVAAACADAPLAPSEMSAAVPQFAAATSTTSTIVPFATVTFVPCANGGAGEAVLLTGNLHVLLHTTISNSGNAHFKVHFQPQGVSGVGLTTGDNYQGTGVTQPEANFNDPLPVTRTFINNFRIIGQGTGNNLLVHQNAHLTINANGEVTATVSNTSVECK